MEPIKLNFYRNGAIFAQPEIDLQTEFNEVLMGVNDIVLNVISPVPLDIQLDDYITFRNENYFIDSVPEYDLINNDSYRYSMKFLHPKFRLNADYIVHLADSTFTYFGDARAHLTVLLASIHSFDSEYTLGEIEETDQLFITYDGSYCLEALTIIAEAFGLEYSVRNKEIDLKKQLGHDTGLTFQYGRGKGLYTLNRKAIIDENVINKVYGYGSSKNIDYSYRNGAKRLMFEGGFLTADTPYALRAGRYVNEEIKPERTAPVTGIEPIADNLFAIYDTTLDFDINDYLIEATTAKVIFKSGELSNVPFEIHKYDPATKKITLKFSVENDGYVLPNDTRMVAVGDEYTLVDIRMPRSYEIDAENRLQAKTQEYLDENKIPKIAYDLPIDPKYIRGLGASLRVGDLVTIIDPAHNINHKLRIIGVRLPLADETQVKVTIANFIPYSYEDRVIASAINTQKEIREVNRQREELARRASMNLRVLETSIFATDGTFDSNKFNVGVLSAALGIFGLKSQNFALSSVVFKPNYQGNANNFQVTNGKLIHREIENASGYEWNLTGLTMTGLATNSLYYVYAKCSRSTATGEFVVTTEQITYDQIAGQYNFLVGVLYPVIDGYRDYDNTYGISTIVGQNITSGIIKSIDGFTVINLNEGAVKLGDFLDVNQARAIFKGEIIVTGGNAETTTGAQAKANVAKTDAINAAAIDASTKSNTAQTNAETYAASKDTQVRQDLRLTAALPTTLTLNSQGITATTPNGSYARLSGQGLVVVGGAIDIRTMTASNRGVQLTANGLFGYNVSGVQSFSLNSETGKFISNNAEIKGKIEADSGQIGGVNGFQISTQSMYSTGLFGIVINNPLYFAGISVTEPEGNAAGVFIARQISGNTGITAIYAEAKDGNAALQLANGYLSSTSHVAPIKALKIGSGTLTCDIHTRYVAPTLPAGGQTVYLPVTPGTGRIITIRHPSNASATTKVNSNFSGRLIYSPGTEGTGTNQIGIRNAEHTLSLYFDGSHWYAI